MRQRPTDISLPGAVDLGALAAQRQAQAAAAERAASGQPAPAHVVDVTEATFQTEVIERSSSVPVVLDFWASWCGPCRQLSPVLEKLATEGDGQWVLAKVDCDAQPRLAQAFGVQGIPAVKVVVAGQLGDGFTGALPEPQVRQFLDSVLELAAKLRAQGQLGGDGAPAGTQGPGDAAEDPRFTAAYDALEREDLAAAEAEFARILAEAPGDPVAKAGSAQVKLFRRTAGADPQQVLLEAQTAPDDVAKQQRAADVELVAGLHEQALARLVDTVRRTSGADRDAARAHLIELFEALDPEDPVVVKARRDLAAALF